MSVTAMAFTPSPDFPVLPPENRTFRHPILARKDLRDLLTEGKNSIAQIKSEAKTGSINRGPL